MRPLWANKYIGIRFRPDGYDQHGCNCWGLVRLVLMRECGLDLPTYGEITAKELLRVARVMDEQSRVWKLVTDMQRCFDVVLMSGRVDLNESAKSPVHCGILVNSQEILHVDEKTDAVCVLLTHRSVAFRRLGIYRYRSEPS